jgi:DnaA family protein
MLSRFHTPDARRLMPRQLALDLLQPPQPTLENFIVGRNAEVVDALRRHARGQSTERQIYLWGAPGSGRSHLLHALAHLPDAWCWQPGLSAERAGIALVDDVEHLAEAAQIDLFRLINTVRARPDASCVIAGAAPPAQLALREDLRTRLAWGLVYQVHALDDTEKARALAAHAASLGVTVSEELVPYLLNHLPRDMRTLVAALDALDAYALARKRPLTVPLLRDWLHGEAT